MPEDTDSPLVRKLIDRTLEDRYSLAAREVEQLIEATFRVIAASGRIDPPVRDILRVAGLSTPVFYRHFRSKDELLLVVWDRGVRMLTAYLEMPLMLQRCYDKKQKRHVIIKVAAPSALF
jgi:AcrR family transcriptional regulator